MPITIAKIAANVSTVSLSIGEDIVHITYYPGRVTEKLIGELQALSTPDEANIMTTFKAFNETLAGLIKSWDIYEDEEQQRMFPIEAARLSELPLSFRMHMVNAIVGDMRPNSPALVA